MTGHLRWTTCLLSASALSCAWPMGAHAVSLNEALAHTYTTNPTLDAARADLRATDEGVPQVLSEWRPTVLGTGQGGSEWSDETRRDNNNNNLNTEDHAWPRSYGVVVSQPIFDGFGTVAGTSLAENLVRAGRARLQATEQTVLLNAVIAYMAVVRDEAVLELNRSNENVIKAQLEATQARFSVGEVTNTDVAQAQSRLQGAVAARIQSEGQLRSSKATYLQVIGEAPVDVSMPESSIQLPSSEEEAVALAKSVPAVRDAEFTEVALKDDIDRQFSELLPTVSIEGSWTRREDFDGEEGEEDIGAIIGQVVVPLYQAGAPDSRVRQAKQRYMQSRRLTDEALRSAEQEAIAAWQAWETVVAQTTSFKEQVHATEVALDGVRQEQAVGSRTVLDILDAENEALNAKVSLVSSQTDTVVAEYRLLAATGALSAQTLKLDVTPYDPTEYYNKVRNKFIGTGPSVE